MPLNTILSKGQYSTLTLSPSPGDQVPLQVDSSGNLKVVGSLSITPTSSSTASALPGVNPISVGAVSVVLLTANSNRKELTIVNTGTTVLFLGLGQTPTTTAYHIALSACTGANDGTGGTYISDIWKGAVNAIGSAGGGTSCVTELT